MISSLIPRILFLFVLLLFEPDLLLPLPDDDVFEELGDAVDELLLLLPLLPALAVFDAFELPLLFALLLLLLFELLPLEDPPPPPPAEPDDPPDCFSFLSLIIIYLFTQLQHTHSFAH
jgi:hypothetical protein